MSECPCGFFFWGGGVFGCLFYFFNLNLFSKDLFSYLIKVLIPFMHYSKCHFFKKERGVLKISKLLLDGIVN